MRALPTISMTRTTRQDFSAAMSISIVPIDFVRVSGGDPTGARQSVM